MNACEIKITKLVTKRSIQKRKNKTTKRDKSENIYLKTKQNSIYLFIYVAFATEELFEVAIESWPEWDLNPQALNSVQRF